ncbi:helix-hairpin-helix domain-containing protein [Halobacillus sp. Marseille-P3879]|uniref:helix-hairpin-helix domain-containing protein n=1 Tax=Halobacillus sp. Marseille-P3879 TaxID=2045014 RepID=UPI000C7BB770|nr:helix-hairpin-helix domain-containing protein [Halobacillus sp. Marseille-P3879]
MLLLKKYGWIALAVIVFMILMLININQEAGLQVKSQLTEEADADTLDENKNEGRDHLFVVDVKGEVAKPGIYEVDEGMRVNDAIRLAGGLTEEADQTSVNLAQKVQDEMVILVMEESGGIKGSSLSTTDNSPSTIRINYASGEEIQSLPGIGPSKAKAIVQYREENGLFKTNEDLLSVAGIGEKTLETLEEYIQLP